tara:strand:- start:179 stop:1396 length:1218 start_codon:yes stop_codon:yes gene_type:complete
MSGIVGSYFNTRGSGVVAKLGTDGQIFTSTGAGLKQGFEAAAASGDKNYKNLIINGDMSQAQRGTSTTSNGYLLDRFTLDEATDGAITYTQDTDVPAGQGFAKSLKLDVTTADASLASGTYCILTHGFEGQNLQHLKYGTSSAETLTLSFWVKSVKTGTYCVNFTKDAGGQTRYETPVEYTISSGSTWEKKTITVTPTAGSTSLITGTAGAIVNSNAKAFRVIFALGQGTDWHGTNNTWVAASDKMSTSNQVNFLDNTSNNFWLTGVQLEVGTSASDFEFLPYDVNLQRCQRYYQKSFDIGTAPAQNVGIQTGDLSFPSTKVASQATTLSQKYNFPVRMRGSPTMTGYNSAATNAQVRDVTGGADCSSTAFASNKETGFYVSCTSSGSTGVGNYLSLHFTAAAEL